MFEGGKKSPKVRKQTHHQITEVLLLVDWGFFNEVSTNSNSYNR